MTVQEYLASLKYTPEQITSIMASPDTVKALEASAARYDEGTQALSKAQKESADTQTFWEQKTTELQGTVDRVKTAEAARAKADSEAARYAAYLKSLKDQGYDVPDELVAAAPANPNPANPNPDDSRYASRDDMKKGFDTVAPTLIQLQALSNEYQSLYGQPYLTGEADWEEAKRANKPFRDFVRTKHGFETKRAEAAAAKVAEREAAVRKEERDKVLAEEAAKRHSETGAPLPSVNARLERVVPASARDSWKSPEGRIQNREARREKFANAPFVN